MLENYLEGLIQQALNVQLIESLDEVYVRNRVYAMFNQDPVIALDAQTDETIPNLVEKIVDEAIQLDVIENVFDEKEILVLN